VAEIEEDNIDDIMNYYTQYYPPADRPDLLLEMAGSHWNSTDPNVRLPRPNDEYEAFLQSESVLEKATS
jgi:hypothetical protein